MIIPPTHSSSADGPGSRTGTPWLVLLLAISLAPALAQDSETPDSEPEAEESEPPLRAIEEIIVTATKREESVRDVPASITALTGQQLEDAGVQSIDQIVDAIPGVNMADNELQPDEGERITIRGISAGNRQNDTVGVFIDETPFTDPFLPVVTADANPFDMSSVEVIKGPVGTLFGGSALNGAIRYVPQKPVFGEWQSKAFSQYSTNSQSEDFGWIVGAAVNVPVFETLALRVVANDREREGWIDSQNQSYKAKDTNRASQESLRATLRWQPLDSLDFSLMLLDQDTRLHDLGMTDAASGGRYERVATAQPSPSRSAYQTWQFKGTWSFDWADLVLVASDSDKHFSSFTDVSYLAETDPRETTVVFTAESAGRPRSQELRLVSAPGGNWNWLGGLYNYKYSVVTDVRQGAPDPGPDGAITSDADVDVTEQAAFGELIWSFGDGFELAGGLRLYEFSYLGETGVGGALCATVDPTCPLTGLRGAVQLDKTERGVSPKLGLKWEINNELMAYSTATRGFRFGGSNQIPHPEIPPVYESDALWSYEIGIRAQWLDDALLTDATVFSIEWDNAQFRSTTSDSTTGYVDNVGSVQGRGLESQIIWRTPLRGVRLALTSAYSKVETSADYTAPSGAVTPAGTPWPLAPKWQTASTLGWKERFGGRDVDVSLTHSYFGEAIQGFRPQDLSARIFDYSTYDMQVTVKNASQGWWPDLALNVRNLGGTQATTFSRPPPAPGAGSFIGYTPPRSISLRLGFTF